MNVGTGFEISIYKLSRMIANILDYNGKIIFDKSSPDGTFPEKNLQFKKILSFGWKPIIKFKEGLSNVVKK